MKGNTVMEKLFGTDGIRGIANRFPMTAETALAVGRAAAYEFGRESQTKPAKIIIGKDTRISGDMIEHALVAGICSMGVDVYLAGVLPTPAIAFLTVSVNASAGIVISASHNPFYDNGIKIFKGDGFKPSIDIERCLEGLIQDRPPTCDTIRRMGRVYILEDACDRYSEFLKQTLCAVPDVKGLKLVLDCANGATYAVAPRVFQELGADVHVLFHQPDGANINADCGSQHPQTLARIVAERKADLGLAFDGDGDRLIAVDENGHIATGDQLLAVCADHYKKRAKLKNNMLVSTVMSNLGLKNALRKLGILHIAANVGDRYVMEEMVKAGAIVGGEDSGHMIFLDHHTTGDGILAGIKVLEAMRSAEKKLSELLQLMTVYPQELINVDVKRKPAIESVGDINAVIALVEDELGDKGRVLVRYSGTQPMCRVMVEGPSHDETQRYCRKIADVVAAVLG